MKSRNIVFFISAFVIFSFLLSANAMAWDCPDMNTPQELTSSVTFGPEPCYINASAIKTGFYMVNEGAGPITIDCNGATFISTEAGKPYEELKGYFMVVLNQTGVTVKNCNIEGFATGIYYNGGSGGKITSGTITGNTLIGNELGVSAVSTRFLEIKGNTLNDNRRGISVWSPGEDVSKIAWSFGNTVERNEIDNAVSTAISITRSSENMIKGNVITNFGGDGSYSAIAVRDGYDNEIEDCTVKDKDGFNPWGIRLRDAVGTIITNTTYGDLSFHHLDASSTARISWYVAFKLLADDVPLKNTKANLYDSYDIDIWGTEGKYTNDEGVIAENKIEEKTIRWNGIDSERSPYTIEFRDYSVQVNIDHSGVIEVSIDVSDEDQEDPVVELVSPEDGKSVLKGDVEFTCEATDDFWLSGLSFYWNETGTFKVKKLVSIDNKNSISYTFVMEDVKVGTYKWNCRATDSTNKNAFADERFIVNVVDELPEGEEEENVTGDADGDGYTIPDDCDDTDDTIYPDGVEACDGKDNDCNGLIDDGIEELRCGKTTGRCEYGVKYCLSGEWSACIGGIGPTDELCNNIDDDCDGEVDESTACCSPIGSTAPCGIYSIGICRQGLKTCGSYGWSACAGEIAPTLEICNNGLDDDCDGLTDSSDTDCVMPGPEMNFMLVLFIMLAAAIIVILIVVLLLKKGGSPHRMDLSQMPR